MKQEEQEEGDARLRGDLVLLYAANPDMKFGTLDPTLHVYRHHATEAFVRATLGMREICARPRACPKFARIPAAGSAF